MASAKAGDTRRSPMLPPEIMVTQSRDVNVVCPIRTRRNHTLHDDRPPSEALYNTALSSMFGVRVQKQVLSSLPQSRNTPFTMILRPQPFMLVALALLIKNEMHEKTQQSNCAFDPAPRVEREGQDTVLAIAGKCKCVDVCRVFRDLFIF